MPRWLKYIHCVASRFTPWSLILVAAALPRLASGETPEAYRRLWNDPAVAKRIDDGIERHRKTDVVVEVVLPDGRPAASATVEVEQQTHAFLFGCNAFVLGQLDSPEKNLKFEQAFTRLFNFTTVPFYWEGTEPVEGELRYAEGSRDIWRRPPPDRFIPFAKKYGITLKGHPLVWHSCNPPWLPSDADALKQLYQKRIQTIADRYAEDIPIWDVVNESLSCPKSFPLYSDDRAYVLWAFQEAHRHFRPDNVLMINDMTSISHDGQGIINAYYRQIRDLQRQGAGIQGVGFQFHFFDVDRLNLYLAGEYNPPVKMLDAYDSFADLGLPLWITEITIPTRPDDGEAVQAEVVRNLYRLWFSAPRMAGITWWNLGDGTAVQSENNARGGLMDENLDPKPSYRALERLIREEWKTRLSVKTDQRGVVRFRGFRGKYSVKVASGGATQEFSLDLSKDVAAPQRLILGGK